MAIADYSLRFPPNFEAEAGIWAAKGYVVLEVEAGGPPPKRYLLTFYDPVRLAQDIRSELADVGAMFAEPNLVVIQTIDRQSVERAVEKLARRDFRGLVPDQAHT